MRKILALLLVLPLLLLTACDFSSTKLETDYDVAYISYGNQMLYLNDIQGYYFTNNGMVVVINDKGKEYKTSIDNVLFYGGGNNEN